ncbi:MAG: aminopeptidase [candidate division KSB1 bacterium]|nr:aminopeptidase [candidate division KSB1 bacterium]MDZ7318612.1 aminopeptidase [candidate division KSB1 bacterium]MDZ7339906.1 aminopeptidase [candidate division KSB1 bacterium]
MAKLEKAIHKLFADCLKIVPGDSCLILVDHATCTLGQRIFKTFPRIKAEVALLEIQPLHANRTEPPAAILNLLKQMSAIVAFTSTSLLHTNALKHLCHNGARVLCLEPMSEDALMRAINTDYQFIEIKSRRLADLFSIGHKIQVLTAAGTDLTIPIARHRGMANTGVVHEPGSFSLLPAGEAAITPDLHGAEGVIVVDGSIPAVGLLQNSIELKVKEGYAYQITGGHEVEKLRKILKPFGKLGRNIAEFGIGTNPHAMLTGQSIEDEKVLGTAHFALGHHAYEGGRLKGKLHLDLILKTPTITIDGRIIMEAGRLLI